MPKKHLPALYEGPKGWKWFDVGEFLEVLRDQFGVDLSPYTLTARFSLMAHAGRPFWWNGKKKVRRHIGCGPDWGDRHEIFMPAGWRKAIIEYLEVERLKAHWGELARLLQATK